MAESKRMRLSVTRLPVTRMVVVLLCLAGIALGAMARMAPTLAQSETAQPETAQSETASTETPTETHAEISTEILTATTAPAVAPAVAPAATVAPAASSPVTSAVGATSTVTSAVAVTSAVTVRADANAASNVHVVAPGETLRAIAESYGSTWQDMAAINRLPSPNLLAVGQELQIFGEIPADFEADYLRPDYDFSDVISATAASAGSPILAGSYVATDEVYTVQAGDTLGQIALGYGVPVSALIQVNNLANPEMIYVGQPIVIAAPATPPAPAAPRAQGKVILVSISEQYLWAYEDGAVVVESFVTTGRPRADTPTGEYEVLVKHTDYRFVSPYPEGHEFYYNPQVSNFSLRYTWDGYHIHDAPWRSDYGPGTNVPHQDSLGRTQTGSIGCTNVTADAMAQLFAWAEVGTPIVIVQ